MGSVSRLLDGVVCGAIGALRIGNGKGLAVFAHERDLPGGGFDSSLSPLGALSFQALNCLSRSFSPTGFLPQRQVDAGLGPRDDQQRGECEDEGRHNEEQGERDGQSR